jgi:hypothetical protein
VYRGLQNCINLLEAASGLCMGMCLTVRDMKVEEHSDIPEEGDPLAVKAEQEL